MIWDVCVCHTVCHELYTTQLKSTQQTGSVSVPEAKIQSKPDFDSIFRLKVDFSFFLVFFFRTDPCRHLLPGIYKFLSLSIKTPFELGCGWREAKPGTTFPPVPHSYLRGEISAERLGIIRLAPGNSDRHYWKQTVDLAVWHEQDMLTTEVLVSRSYPWP